MASFNPSIQQAIVESVTDLKYGVGITHIALFNPDGTPLTFSGGGVAGPSGPTGPVGPTGPTGPAGSAASPQIGTDTDGVPYII